MFGLLSAKQRSKHSCKYLTCQFLRVFVLTRPREAVPMSCKTTETIQLEIQRMLMLAKVKSQISLWLNWRGVVITMATTQRNVRWNPLLSRLFILKLHLACVYYISPIYIIQRSKRFKQMHSYKQGLSLHLHWSSSRWRYLVVSCGHLCSSWSTCVIHWSGRQIALKNDSGLDWPESKVKVMVVTQCSPVSFFSHSAHTGNWHGLHYSTPSNSCRGCVICAVFVTAC